MLLWKLRFRKYTASWKMLGWCKSNTSLERACSINFLHCFLWSVLAKRAPRGLCSHSCAKQAMSIPNLRWLSGMWSSQCHFLIKGASRNSVSKTAIRLFQEPAHHAQPQPPFSAASGHRLCSIHPGPRHVTIHPRGSKPGFLVPPSPDGTYSSASPEPPACTWRSCTRVSTRGTGLSTACGEAMSGPITTVWCSGCWWWIHGK